MITGYLAADGFERQLGEELAVADAASARWHGRLLLLEGEARQAAWAANIWRDVRETPIASIADAAQTLRNVQRNWALYAPEHHRRAKLIEEKLPHVSAKPLAFPAAAPTAPLGSFTLLASDRLAYAAQCSSAFANGEIALIEDKAGPPNRAYLKLWEALIRIGRYPRPNDLCLDLGAAPGGWTWVLAKLGARVIAVDKARLDPKVAAMPGVEWRGTSAFALDPSEFTRVDWLFCDVICYPARLLKTMQRWIDSGKVRNFVCTIKFQGDTDHETARAFAAIPGSRLFHLHNNKHELTWVWRALDAID
jgi:23S rRNA (cytidine2498-2'-O)-methyltransferase